MSQDRLPPLNALRAFEAAGRLGSFVAAAQALHVTQPAIGRHIKALEDWLGARLFERTPRGIVLTDEGRRYHEQVHAALEAIAEATQAFSSRGRQRWLRLLVVPGLAARWLRQRLAGFRHRHPDIRVAVEPNASFTEVAAARADLGIAFGEPQDFGGEAELLVRPPIFPVCAPSLLARLGPPASAAALRQWPLLHEDDGSWWADWFRGVGVRARPVSEVAYTSADEVLHLALAGEGLALTNPLLVEQELASARLVRPLPAQCMLGGYVLLSPPGALPAPARLFREWLIGEL